MSFLESLYNRSVENGNGDESADDAEWKKEFPSIHEFITSTSFKGKVRQPGKLQITSDATTFRVSIIDNTQKAMLSAIGKTVMLALIALEHKSSMPQSEWHRWGKAPSTSKRSVSGSGGQRKG